MQVESLRAEKHPNSQDTVPVTRLHYQNFTNNRFGDLTIKINVEAQNQIFDLSYLFTPNMVMVGQDRRNRTFKILDELNKKGLDLISCANQGNEVILNLAYSYTFNNFKDEVTLQGYRWNPEREIWDII